MSAIQFLTTVSRSSRNSSLFQSADALKQICEKIVIPNLRLNDDLEEMFEMNYVEYIRRDTEGSDFDTRRRAATELVKALNTQFEAEVQSHMRCRNQGSHCHFTKEHSKQRGLDHVHLSDHC